MNNDRAVGLRLTPINRRRLDNFKANRRGYWSFWIFLVIFILVLVYFLGNIFWNVPGPFPLGTTPQGTSPKGGPP